MNLLDRIYFLFYLILVRPVVILLKRKRSRPWVIGGHAGKLYADNCAALHQYIIRETDQSIIWIGNSPEDIKTKINASAKVLQKNTLAARIAIDCAPVLIRSHGYGDLDSWLLRWTRPQGLLIHVSHSMSFMKRGQMAHAQVAQMSEKEKQQRIKNLVNFDYWLCCSPQERENYRLSMPHLSNRIILGGGAHLDLLKTAKPVSSTPTVLYFPTWRDNGFLNPDSLDDQLQRLCTSHRLPQWLEDNDTIFLICSHINSKNNISNSLNERIKFLDPGQAVSGIAHCDLFISDYSGAIADALFVDKPVVFFPFDLEKFAPFRGLYEDYDSFAFGPIVKSVDELVDLIISKQWRDLNPYLSARKQAAEKFFPVQFRSFSARTYEAVRHLLNNKPPETIL